MKLQKQAFWKIKKKFKEESILIHFNYEKSVIIDADTSKKTMKAWLQQIDDEKQKWLITCYAWKLIFMKQWYDIHDRKILTIIKALK